MNKEHQKAKKIDRVYLASVLLLAIGGFFVFSSASLGLLARNDIVFQSVTLTQSIGLALGLIAFFVLSKINYKYFRKYALYLLILAVLVNLLLFIPAITLTHGGASRWIDLGFITFQPSEFLKIVFIIYFATWLSGAKEEVATWRFGILPYIVIVGILSVLLLKQNDLDTIIVISGTGLAMLFSAGARIKDFVVLILIMALLLAVAIYFKPHARERISTFVNPSADVQGGGYQIKQSLIAIGSGGILGRGYGQSVQKFNYLPEPIGDSIFAVQAEEFGFIGSIALLSLYLLFLFRSFKIAVKSPDSFGGLVVVGIAILTIIESFMNISSMLGIIPLSGMPLLFVSHGGTALIIILGASGIIANVSRYQKSL